MKLRKIIKIQIQQQESKREISLTSNLLLTKIWIHFFPSIFKNKIILHDCTCLKKTNNFVFNIYNKSFLHLIIDQLKLVYVYQQGGTVGIILMFYNQGFLVGVQVFERKPKSLV